MNRTNDTLASLDRIGETLAETSTRQAQPKSDPAEHEQLAAELAAAQSKWFSWNDLAGDSDAA